MTNNGHVLIGAVLGAALTVLIMKMSETDWKDRYMTAQKQTNTFRSENAWLRIELDACDKGNKILKDRCILD